MNDVHQPAPEGSAGAPLDGLTPLEIFGPFPAAPRKPRRDDRFEFEAEGLDERGHGRAAIGVYSVRMPRVLPGERVLAQVVRRRKNGIEARVLERLAPSPDAVEARCPHTRDCGGCKFQELSLPRQLGEKRRLAGRRLASLVGQLPGELPPVIPSPKSFHYRNKMDFTFASARWTEAQDDGRRTDFALGLHAPGRHDKGLDVLACAIAFEGADRLLATVRELALASPLDPWDNHAHSGHLRHLVVRRGEATGELLVDLVTAEGCDGEVDVLAHELLARHPEITTLVHNSTDRLSSVAIGDRERVLHGPGYLLERLGGLEFQVSAESFFQTNTLAAEGLVRAAGEFLARGSDKSSVLWDVCCGTGTFGLTLTGSFEQVFGVEISPSAVADARAVAARNGISNARFEAADAKLALAEGQHDWPHPDAVLCDPPRAGLPPGVAAAIAGAQPGRVGYVSCNLGSAVRDLPAFLEAGYRIERVQLFDLFPHTPHLEALFGLERVT